MIQSFKNTTHLEIYEQALKLTDFNTIKDTFLAQLDNSEAFNNETKLAIKLAAEKLSAYPNSGFMVQDGALLGIMNIDWESVGASTVTALTFEQRIAILEGVLAVCKSIILQESDRLATIASKNSHIQYGYGYGANGYGYGFENIDYFDVFGV